MFSATARSFFRWRSSLSHVHRHGPGVFYEVPDAGESPILISVPDERPWTLSGLFSERSVGAAIRALVEVRPILVHLGRNFGPLKNKAPC